MTPTHLRTLASYHAGTDLPARIALITGITGQDGSYLAEFLLGKMYEWNENNLEWVEA